MTQDVVTAKEVAIPAAVTLPPQDAQPICDKLDRALKEERYRRTAYSEPVRSLFQLAWAVASHKRTRQVTVYHLRCPRQRATDFTSCLGFSANRCRSVEAGGELISNRPKRAKKRARVGCDHRGLCKPPDTGAGFGAGDHALTTGDNAAYSRALKL